MAGVHLTNVPGADRTLIRVTVVTLQQPLGFTTSKLLRQLRQLVPDEYFRASGLHARERVLDYRD